MQGVYKIENRVNGKVYIGSSKNIKKRWQEHYRTLEAGKHKNVYLQSAWNKYGAESFRLEILEEIEEVSLKELWAQEQLWLDRAGEVYNIAEKVGGGNLGHEVNEKRRVAILRHYQTHEGYWTGKTLTDEHIKKSAKGRRGLIPWNKGKKLGPQSEERRLKNSIALTGRIVSEETRKKTSETLKGHLVSIETRQKISEKITAWHRTHEHFGAKSYPALYNVKTRASISAGHNLAKMCRDQSLGYQKIWALVRGNTKQTKDGWKVAI